MGADRDEWREQRQRGRIPPLLGLSMAVGEGKAAGAIMIVRRHVAPAVMRGHIHQKIPIINVIRVLIHKDKGLRGRRPDDFGILPVSEIKTTPRLVKLENSCKFLYFLA